MTLEQFFYGAKIGAGVTMFLLVTALALGILTVTVTNTERLWPITVSFVAR